MTTALNAHRWYVLASFGSFVAEAEGGTLLVAPMNANGSRSTFEGEIVALGEDTRAEDPAHAKVVARAILVGKIADQFRAVLRSWLSEAECLEVDARNRKEKNENICHTHDFCDSNEAMLQALETITGREMNIGNDDDNALFNDAWSLAKDDGFSTYRPMDEDLANLEQVAANAELGIAEPTDAKWLRLFADRLRARLIAPAPFDPSTDAERQK